MTNLAQAEGTMTAAHAQATAAQAALVALEKAFNQLGRERTKEDVEGQEKAREALAAANAKHEQALTSWRSAQAQAALEARAQDRLERKRALVERVLPDIGSARSAVAAKETSLTAEQERLERANAAERAALQVAARAAPDSREFKSACIAHAEAKSLAEIAASRFNAAQLALMQARVALGESEHFTDLVAFEESADIVADLGDRFLASAQAARAALAAELEHFTQALLATGTAYSKLPLELRSTRSPFGNHRLGEFLARGGSADPFAAARSLCSSKGGW